MSCHVGYSATILTSGNERCSRLQSFLDLISPPEEPWYSLATVVQQWWSWELRTLDHAILTVHDMHARILVTGSVSSLCFRSSLVEATVRGHITIKLLRQRDRVALAGINDRGRWTAEQKAHRPSLPMPYMTAIAVQNRKSVGAHPHKPSDDTNTHLHIGVWEHLRRDGRIRGP